MASYATQSNAEAAGWVFYADATRQKAERRLVTPVTLDSAVTRTSFHQEADGTLTGLLAKLGEYDSFRTSVGLS